MSLTERIKREFSEGLPYIKDEELLSSKNMDPKELISSISNIFDGKMHLFLVWAAKNNLWPKSVNHKNRDNEFEFFIFNLGDGERYVDGYYVNEIPETGAIGINLYQATDSEKIYNEIIMGAK